MTMIILVSVTVLAILIAGDCKPTDSSTTAEIPTSSSDSPPDSHSDGSRIIRQIQPVPNQKVDRIHSAIPQSKPTTVLTKGVLAPPAIASKQPIASSAQIPVPSNSASSENSAIPKAGKPAQKSKRDVEQNMKPDSSDDISHSHIDSNPPVEQPTSLDTKHDSDGEYASHKAERSVDSSSGSTNISAVNDTQQATNVTGNPLQSPGAVPDSYSPQQPVPIPQPEPAAVDNVPALAAVANGPAPAAVAANKSRRSVTTSTAPATTSGSTATATKGNSNGSSPALAGNSDNSPVNGFEKPLSGPLPVSRASPVIPV